MELGRIGMATTVLVVAAHRSFQQGAGDDLAELGYFGEYPSSFRPSLRTRWHSYTLASPIPHLVTNLQYIYSVLTADVASVIDSWTPRRFSDEVATFARSAVRAAAPKSGARARAFLFATSKVAVFATSLGLELTPSVVFADSFIERFIVTLTTGMSPATRRTLRSNLRFIGRANVALAVPGPIALSRERTKPPYGQHEIDAYLALADAQPTASRCQHLCGLIALGAGAGLMGLDLRSVRGTDVLVRSGGVLVVVGGTRARVVPVQSRYQDRLLSSAKFAGEGYVIGGVVPTRRNVTSRLVASPAGGIDLPTIDIGRLRATWLRTSAELIGLGAFMAAAGISCTQRLGDLVATLPMVDEATAVALLGATRSR
jgi:hypothetical protein